MTRTPGLLVKPAIDPVAAYQAAVLAKSPIGYWPMSETSGTTANDISGNSRPLTYNGSPTLAQSGRFTAPLFAAASSQWAYRDSAAALTPDTYTAMCWATANSPNDLAGVMSSGYFLGSAGQGTDATMLEMRYRTTATAIENLGQGANPNGSGSLSWVSTSTFHFLCLTHNGTTGATLFYWDGALKATAGSTWTTYPLRDRFTVGGWYFSSTGTRARGWSGKICQAAMFNSILTATDISTIYGAAPP